MQQMQEMQVQSLGQEDSLEEGMATYFSILAWKILLTEEPGGLQSMGLQSQTQVSTNGSRVIIVIAAIIDRGFTAYVK